MEALQKKHRAEQRDLQARITQKKKSATKKTRKGVNEECSELERQLQEAQDEELKQFNNEPKATEYEERADPSDIATATGKHFQVDSVNNPRNGIQPASEDSQPLAIIPEPQSRKPNRQKARLARRAAQQEASAAQAAQEAEDLPDLREQELFNMGKELEKRSLWMKSIPSDGHCLYSAVADQLSQQEMSLNTGMALIQGPSYKTVRAVAADYMYNHPNDFSPFLEEPLETYIEKIRDTGEWGGHLELSALANAYKLKINVLQSNGRVDVIEPSHFETEIPIWLGYYRHSFGLGEHYNSLRSTRLVSTS